MDVLTVVILAAVLGTIPGAIAQKKGYGFIEWWLFGAALFVVALPASLIVKPLPPTGPPTRSAH
jgi:hypothetical protein